MGLLSVLKGRLEIAAFFFGERKGFEHIRAEAWEMGVGGRGGGLELECAGGVLFGA